MAESANESAVRKSSEVDLSDTSLSNSQSLAKLTLSDEITSTSTPNRETDDDDGGLNPSQLYVTYTWNIDKFSQINKRELRSKEFKVGNYKWYILIYPQGCDVCNHLSLFLCVSDHEKLLPGWRHYAQFTMTVKNKDDKKLKYSDTLHRFCKKEHDWGWKKFMELSKVFEEFVIDDRLTIEAQVQVIRHKPDRPFRCLERKYRMELVRSYYDICHRSVEERRNKFVNLREDKTRWSSISAFWMAIDLGARWLICREKRDPILRSLVKNFFIDKEVTSPLVMDSLYSGLRALEYQSKSGSKESAKGLPLPIVHVEKDMFILVDDVLKLLERASMEALPPTNDKGSQNRMKDECLEEDSDAYEWRLTELGRRTIELFVLGHIFSKIEVAYQETVAYKMQEELIREEAVWLAETEQKSKHAVSEKEKKLKKKQARQKRNNRKEKDKGKIEKPSAAVENDFQPGSSSDDKEVMAAGAELLSDVSNSLSCLPEFQSSGFEERDSSWDNNALDTHPPTDPRNSGISGHSVFQKGIWEKKNPYLFIDSSATCSTDLAPSVVVDGLYNGYSLPKSRNRKSVNRIKNQQGSKTTDGVGYYNRPHCRKSEATNGASKLIGAGESFKAEQSKVVAPFLKSRKDDENHPPKKEKLVFRQQNPTIKGQAIEEKHPNVKAGIEYPSHSTPSKIMSSTVPVKRETKISSSANPVVTERVTSVINTADSTSTVKLEAFKVVPQKATNKPSTHPLPTVSRLPHAGLVINPKPSTSIGSHVQTSAVLSRTVSAAGHLGPNTLPTSLPLSYKNAIMGITQSQPPISSLNSSQAHTQMSNSPSSLCDPSRLHTPVSPFPSSSFNPSQSHTQMTNSSNYLSDLSQFRTKGSPSPYSSFNPSQTYTQVSHSRSSSLNQSQAPYSRSSSLNQSQASTQVSNSPSSSFNLLQSHTELSHSLSSPIDSLHSHMQMPSFISASMSSLSSPEGIKPVSSNPSIAFGMVNQNMLRNRPHLRDTQMKENSNSPGLINTSQPMSNNGLGDDFPHLDIINNLLDDEQGSMIENLHSLSSGASQLRDRVSFPMDINGISAELMAASTSSCRFDRGYYDDGYPLGYGSIADQLYSLELGDMIPQINQVLYVNEPIDGLLSQWQMNGADLSNYIGTNVDADGYPYNFPEYANLACGVMDYTAFGPSNAH